MERMESLLTTLRSEKPGAPCVSIYLNKPETRVSGKVASIELYRQLAYARNLLESSRSRREAANYVLPLLRVAKDELLSDTPGTMALFQVGEISICARVPGGAPEAT